MPTITNSALAAQVTGVLARLNGWQNQLADWLAGAPNGGPNGDGRFPLTDAGGDTALYLSLPSIQNLVSGPAAAADASKVAAEAAVALADNHRMNAATARTAAEAARDVAQQLRSQTEIFRNEVAARWASVRADAGQVAADRVFVDSRASDADLDAIAAEAARVFAEAAAARAATFDPQSYILKSLMGAASGVATLNSAGQIPNNQLPAVVLVDTYEVASEAAQLGLIVQQGDVCVRSDLNKSFIRKQSARVGTMADWQELRTPTDAVLSVNGRVGAVDLNDLYLKLSGGSLSGNLTLPKLISGDLVARGTATEGGQLVLGYGGGAATAITGQAASTWNVDVTGSNSFRILRVNSAGATLDALIVTEAGVPTFSHTPKVGAANVALASDVNAGFLLRNVGTGHIDQTSYFKSNGRVRSGSASLQVFSEADADGSFMAFHRGGRYAVKMGLDADNVFRLGGWSDGDSDRWNIDTGGNMHVRGNLACRDGYFNRGDGTGAIYFGGRGDRYLYWDTANWHLPGGALFVGGDLYAAGVRVPRHTISTAGPSGGSSGDVWYVV